MNAVTAIEVNRALSRKYRRQRREASTKVRDFHFHLENVLRLAGLPHIAEQITSQWNHEHNRRTLCWMHAMRVPMMSAV